MYDAGGSFHVSRQKNTIKLCSQNADQWICRGKWAVPPNLGGHATMPLMAAICCPAHRVNDGQYHILCKTFEFRAHVSKHWLDSDPEVCVIC